MKKFFYYLNPRHLCAEMEGYGYEYSLKRTLRNYGIYLAAGVVVGLCYRLQIGYLLVMLLIGFLFLPQLLLQGARSARDQKRFWDVVEYMDQILSAFRQRKRFFPALEEIQESFAGRPIHESLMQALDCRAESTQAQEKAYAVIEKDYGCTRLKNIHRYFLVVQELGGDVSDAVAILQTDVREWEMRQQENQMRRVKAKRNVYVSLGVATVFEIVILWLLYARSLDIMQIPLVQIAAVVQWLLSLFLIFRAEEAAAIDWMEERKGKAEARILGQYRYVTEFDKPAEIKKSLLAAAVPAAAALVLVILHRFRPLALILFAIAAVLALSYKIGYGLAYRDVVRALRRAFPVWIMDVTLRMQTDSVQVALYGSYESAPAILQPALTRFYDALKEDPTSIAPYLSFLSEFHIRGVSSFMRKIYAIYEGTSVQEQEAVLDIVSRNNALLGDAEREYNEDAAAPLYAMFYMPMLIAGAKMMVDMLMMMLTAFANIGSIG